jgi:drug/metabolite transporter (DMT)-like permease
VTADRARHALRHALPLFIVAGLSLSALDTTAKYLVRDTPLLVVVWARYAGQTLVVTPLALHQAGRGFWRTARLPLHLVRSACLLSATACFFGGLRFLPLAEASSIMFLSPIFVVLLSQRVLGERPTRDRVLASLVGFVGILIVLRPGSAAFHPAALLLVGAGASNALYQLLTRRLRDENVHTSLFYGAIVGTVGLSLALPWLAGDLAWTWRDVALLLLLGAFAATGHFCMTRAYMSAPASLLTPFTYLQIVWATAFGYAFFGQHPDGFSAAGMAVIAASGVVLALRERARARHG